uniref:Zinc transporter ZIP1 n=1 Tax=Caenorhabditis japonica TaxID=281687 RepID=A0A8R1DR41_CAEJA
MDLEVLKWILLGTMALMTIIFGLLPMKLIDYLNNTNSTMHKHSSLLLSLFSCFAGGVFLSVCFLDMLPDALESWEAVRRETNFTSDYPFVQLFALCGFFFVYLTEELSNVICHVGHGHSHSNEPMMESNVTFPRARLATVGSIFNVEGNLVQPCKRSLQDYDEDGEAPIRQSIIFTSAFILHVFFECFAFGVQEDTVSITSLFLGIALHKAIVMFSLGMKLTRSHPERRYVVVILIVVLAVFNVIGGSCGILIESSNMNQTPKDTCTAVLTSFSLGTFIYISFFEMLAPERANNHSNMLQWLASVAGCALLAANMIWAS